MNLSRVLTLTVGSLALGTAAWVLHVHGGIDWSDANPLALLSRDRAERVDPRPAGGAPSADPVSAAQSRVADTSGAQADRDQAAQDEDVTKALVDQAVQAMFSGEANGEGTPSDSKGSAGKGEGAAKDSGKAGNAKRHKKANEDSEKDGKDGRAPAQSERLRLGADEARRAGDYARAAEMLQQSIEADPRNSKSYRNLASLYRDMGQPELERQVYAQWTEQFPNDPSPHYLMAQNYLKAGMNDEAYAELLNYQQASGGAPASMPMTANMYRQLGMAEEEGATLQQWVSAAPGSSDAHRAMGQYYQRMGDMNAALDEYQTTATLAPGEARAYLDMATLYQRMGDQASAQAQLETALEVRPANMDVRIRLASSYQQTKQVDAALEMYQSVVDMEPGSRQAQQAERQITRLERQVARAQQRQATVSSGGKAAQPSL